MANVSYHITSNERDSRNFLFEPKTRQDREGAKFEVSRQIKYFLMALLCGRTIAMSKTTTTRNTNGLTTTIPEGNLLFAVPKKGRLYERVLELLKGCGISFRRKARLDIANSTNMPISLIFLNAHDVAVFVGEGAVDLGITGEDIIAESQSNVDVCLKLNIGQCKLCLQAPKDLCHQDPQAFSGARVVTSFPHLTKEYFDKLDAVTGKTTHIQCISGSVEAACGLGLADAVVDLVETGTTMRAAGLDVVDSVMATETVLVSNPNTKHRALIVQLTNRITGWMLATSYNVSTHIQWLFVDFEKGVQWRPYFCFVALVGAGVVGAGVVGGLTNMLCCVVLCCFSLRFFRCSLADGDLQHIEGTNRSRQCDNTGHSSTHGD